MTPLPAACQQAINKQLQMGAAQSFQAVYNGMRSAYPGDPLVWGNFVIPNTTITWVTATQAQQTAYNWYMEGGMVIPSDFQEMLNANVGPTAYYNFSYAQFGLIQGTPADPSIKFVTGVEPSTANMVTVMVYPA